MISKRQIDRLKVLSYPDPILRKKAAPVQSFEEKELRLLVEKMWALMHEHKGVGLAGPQVGVSARLFVWNSSGEPDQDRVCINPKLNHLAGQAEAEEGCLSIDGVVVRVVRAETAEITAQDIDGSAVQYSGSELAPRIWQHEIDHLDGRLILDYMSSAEEIANRRALKELEANYRSIRKRGPRGDRR